ncbi:hypothetical protein LCGC14_1314580 [marine sediment metagenome]|uniref:Uncharacterized protein n=1 Tax=marine sediment metagenome TaxID=412755 RepID=A0A0F9KLX3_9ZZZZ
MASIEDLKTWFDRDLGRFAKWDTHILAEKPYAAGEIGKSEHVCYPFSFFTHTHKWRMVLINRAEPSLMCNSDTRKPRAGEDWTRGRDMTEGPLNEETWRAFLAEIVSYEIIEISGFARSNDDKPDQGLSSGLPAAAVAA